MTNPIDIIANAMRVADGNHTMGTGQLAEVAVNALAHEQIVTDVGFALFEDQQANGARSALGASTMFSPVDCEGIARFVLRSVGGA